jgi:hypothetical protein
VFAATAVLGILLASSLAMGAAGIPSKMSARPSLSSNATPGTTDLAAAELSLEQGSGPAAHRGFQCGSTSGVSSAICRDAGPGLVSGPSAEPISPASRAYGTSLVYDAADHYVLYFSGAGEASGLGNETWTFASDYWTNITTASAPPARLGASMTYDTKDGYVVLFGGLGGLTVGADTWKFLAGSWTQLTPAKSPSAREDAQIAYDAKDGYVLLYGGLSLGGAGNALGDTWTFVGGKWTHLNLIAGSSAPQQRYDASMAYDAKDGYVVLFAGDVFYKGSGYYILNDTYTFSGGTWTRLNPSSAPSPRTNAGFSYDQGDGYLLLFGGQGLSVGGLSDSWTFSGGTWTQLSGTHPSNASWNLVGDPLDGYVLLFVGGTNESWKFFHGGWMPLVSARESAGLVYDAADHYVLLFGGLTGSGPVPRVLSAETWKFVGGVWTNLTASVVGSPSAREWFGMTYDAKDGYVVLFGGDDGTSVLGDTWTYLAGTWTHLSLSTSPSPRIEPSMTYDAGDGYVVLFGGASSLINLDRDTWKFVGGVWTNLTGKISPPSRVGAAMAYDAADGYVLLFGGIGTSSANGGYLRDTWTFSAGAWTHLTITIHPLYRADATMTYDAADGYIVFFGGLSSSTPSGYHSDTWKYLGGVWTKLSLTTSPKGEVNAMSTYDGQDGYMVVFGGETSAGPLRGDTWEFASGSYSLIIG